jgi:hypothetical protein
MLRDTDQQAQRHPRSLGVRRELLSLRPVAYGAQGPSLDMVGGYHITLI